MILPVQQEPVQPAPAQHAPVEQAPVQQAPVQQAPVEQAPVQEAPVQQAPVQQAPVQEAPVQEAPVQEAPVQPAPVPIELIAPVPVQDVVSVQDAVSVSVSESASDLSNGPAVILPADANTYTDTNTDTDYEEGTDAVHDTVDANKNTDAEVESGAEVEAGADCTIIPNGEYHPSQNQSDSYTIPLPASSSSSASTSTSASASTSSSIFTSGPSSATTTPTPTVTTTVTPTASPSAFATATIPPFLSNILAPSARFSAPKIPVTRRGEKCRRRNAGYKSIINMHLDADPSLRVHIVKCFGLSPDLQVNFILDYVERLKEKLSEVKSEGEMDDIKAASVWRDSIVNVNQELKLKLNIACYEDIDESLSLPLSPPLTGLESDVHSSSSTREGKGISNIGENVNIIGEDINMEVDEEDEDPIISGMNIVDTDIEVIGSVISIKNIGVMTFDELLVRTVLTVYT